MKKKYHQERLRDGPCEISATYLRRGANSLEDGESKIMYLSLERFFYWVS